MAEKSPKESALKCSRVEVVDPDDQPELTSRTQSAPLCHPEADGELQSKQNSPLHGLGRTIRRGRTDRQVTLPDSDSGEEERVEEDIPPLNSKRSGFGKSKTSSCASLRSSVDLSARATRDEHGLTAHVVIRDERLSYRQQKTVNMSEETRRMLFTAIKDNAFCAQLAENRIEDIIERMQYFVFKEGQTICSAGEDGHYFLIVDNGELAVL